MKYFKNIELARLYHVSEKSVRNWIQGSLDGKIDLQLHQENGRAYIANTTRNTTLVEHLVEKGKKYKNTRGFKRVTPQQEFYKTYTLRQILDITSNLTVYKEMPLQYSYFDGGANYWNKYSYRLINEQEPNILNKGTELLDQSEGAIDSYFDGYKKINIVDLGPGNGLPIKGVVKRLHEKGLLNKYIAVDISQDMLDIVEENMKEWFGGKITIEKHIKDLTYERFDDIFINDSPDDTINLVFLLGGTLSNFRDPRRVLQVIGSSIGINDLFLYTTYLDTPRTRLYFDFKVPAAEDQKLSFTRHLYDVMGIDQSLYDVKALFNTEKHERCIQIIPKVDISIELDLPSGRRHVELTKGEPILDWRHLHFTAVDLINMWDENGLDLLQATKSLDQQYLLLMSKIKVSGE